MRRCWKIENIINIHSVISEFYSSTMSRDFGWETLVLSRTEKIYSFGGRRWKAFEESLTNFSFLVERWVLLIKQIRSFSSHRLKKSTVAHLCLAPANVGYGRVRMKQRTNVKHLLVREKSLNIQQYEICKLSWRQNTWRFSRSFVSSFLSNFYIFLCC